MQYSHSRVDCFEKCKYQYHLRYNQRLTTINPPSADNPLIVGLAMHLGIEEGKEAMERYYYHQYPLITDLHINEMIKLKPLVEKVQVVMEDLVQDNEPTVKKDNTQKSKYYAVTNQGIIWGNTADVVKRKIQRKKAKPKPQQYKNVTFEYEINFPKFKGFVDLIIHNQDFTIDVYDFKYSNNVENYLQSKQLHLYKYFLDKSGYTVSKLGYIFIPKTFIRQKKTEDLYQFRKRLQETLLGMEVKIIEIPYDRQKVEDFFNSCKEIETVTTYEKTPSKLCDWCEFQQYCEEELDYMLLPKNEKREKQIDLNPDKWIYGDSYVGKSSFIDAMEDLLFINTDGNVDNTTSPIVRITDEVSYEGRLRKEKLAWDVFLEVITELEKKENTFKRVAVDLVEDLYEHCRLYTYRKLGIDHEQDAGFGKGWDMVRTEFLSAMKRLKNLGYQIIFISKEVNTEITLKNGSKLTTIKPNLNDKVANVLTGIVDLTARAYMDGEARYLLLEKQENVFGGGRFNFKAGKVELNINSFIEALKQAQEGMKTYSKAEVPKAEASENPKEETPDVTEPSEKPARKSRRSSKE